MATEYKEMDFACRKNTHLQSDNDSAIIRFLLSVLGTVQRELIFNVFITFLSLSFPSP